MRNSRARAKKIITLTESKGTGMGTHINVTGGRLFKFLGDIPDPSCSGEVLRSAWSMRIHNADTATLVTRDDVEVAMHQHGWTL